MTDATPHDRVTDAIRGMHRNLLATGCLTHGTCSRCGGSARGADLCARCHCADLGAIVGHELAGELLTTYERARWQQRRAFAAVTA